MSKLIDLLNEKIDGLDESEQEAYFHEPRSIIRQWRKGKKPPTNDALEKIYKEYSEKNRESENTGTERRADQNVSDQGSVVSGSDDKEKQIRSDGVLAAFESGDSSCVENIVEDTESNGNCAILMPVLKYIEPDTSLSVQKLVNLNKAEWFYEKDTCLWRCRNRLVKMFLQTKKEWSLWIDSDMLVQCGHAEWLNWRRTTFNLPEMPKNYADVNTIARLIKANKTIISGLYYGRHPKGEGMFMEAMNTSSKSSASRTLSTKVVESKWVATGCLLIHRSVYEDIDNHAKQISQHLQNGFRQAWNFDVPTGSYDNDYFTPMYGNQGEDFAFCVRAAAVNHLCYVDHAVRPGHIGSMIYSAENTRG